ncbi:MAG TPA: DUF5691 domain-containing protein [Ktedonobacterales bacterium]|nr:DUF5691 domain-containing protein [Ktedonobacterales bacterium]
MRDLLTTALAGTAQTSATQPPATGTPADALLAALPEGEAERRLLLAAGSASVYHQSGYVPMTIERLPAPAPEEHLPICTPGAALLLRQLFAGQQSELLPEALERLARAGLRLPAEMLPLALSVRDKQQRVALVPVIGKRGRWLARLNFAWSWVEDVTAGEAAAAPDEAETIWQEGTPAQRIAVLRRMRATTSDRGREWVAAVWKQEKADFRVELLHALESGLSLDDEAFLEAARDDRSSNVRAAAAELLMKQPGSAYIARMTARADAMLNVAGDKLNVQPPKQLTKDAVRDGIAEKPPAGGEAQATWLVDIVGRVPPSHWRERFGLSPAELITAAAQSAWRVPLLEGWTYAAVAFGEHDWAPALWETWSGPIKKTRARGPQRGDYDELRTAVAPLLPREVAESRALAAIETTLNGKPQELEEVLSPLARPWSLALSEAYLRGLAAFCGRLDAKSKSLWPYDDTLDMAARALSPECFAAALAPIKLPEGAKHWAMTYFRQQFDAFTDVIHLRQRIVEEIPL